MTSPERRIGSWTLGEILGEGGNSVVYRASREDLSDPVALKVIHERRVEQESYQRFLREVDFMASHGSTPGLLPLIDYHLPERPTKADRAWLATPVAMPIDEALEQATLDEVVRAVGTIARTLATLQEEFDIAHRDIKPGNLYQFGHDWLIGDFGLISVPDVDALTKDGRQVGPANFTAFEMIDTPSSSDFHSADVFSLGKTLWVLATGLRWAPSGHQPADSPQWTIGDFRPHVHSHELDQLVDRMTRLRPTERPTKSEVVRDLDAWLSLPSGTAVLDWSAYRDVLRRKLQSHLSDEEEVANLKAAGQQAARRFTELTARLNEELKRIWPGTEVDITSDRHTQNTVKAFQMHGVAEVFDWQRCTKLSTGRGPLHQKLRVSRRIQVFRDGQVAVTWQVLVSADTMGNNWFAPGSHSNLVPAASIALEQLLQTTVVEIEGEVQKALQAIAERLPGTDS